MALKAKMRVFAIEYLACWNAAEAARRAGYRDAYHTGSRLLRNPHIFAFIEEAIKLRQMGADEVLGRLSDQARGSLRPFVRISADGHVEFDFSTQEAIDNLHLVKSVRTKRKRLVAGRGEETEEWEHEWVEVELYNSQAALELIGKHHKLFTERIEHGGTVSIPGFDEQLERAYGSRSKT